MNEHGSSKEKLIVTEGGEDIGYYIETLRAAGEVASKLMRKDPETRAAILNAKYEDLLALRVAASYTAFYLNHVNQAKTLQADPIEAVLTGCNRLQEYGP